MKWRKILHAHKMKHMDLRGAEPRLGPHWHLRLDWWLNIMRFLHRLVFQKLLWFPLGNHLPDVHTSALNMRIRCGCVPLHRLLNTVVCPGGLMRLPRWASSKAQFVNEGAFCEGEGLDPRKFREAQYNSFGPVFKGQGMDAFKISGNVR